MTANYKFCVQTQLFNVSEFILPMLENCGPHVERIYIARTERPWNYNPTARESMINKTPASILDQSPWRHKITLVEGDWESEHEQRNALLDRARADGMDFMIIQDADEFYFHEDFAKNLAAISQKPDYDLYGVRWYVFWKDIRHIITDRYDRHMDDGWVNFAVNCRGPMRFNYLRGTKEKFRVYPGYLPGPACHLSYVMSDEAMLEKLSSWGHTNDFNWRKWYDGVWLKWWPGRWHLALIKPHHWARAIPFPGRLPEVLENFEGPPISAYQATWLEKFLNSLKGRLTLFYYRAKMPLYHFKRYRRNKKAQAAEQEK